MQQLWKNYKKDGPDRKTADYVKRRIDTLDKYWGEFKRNHELLKHYEDQDIDYFKDFHYQESEKFYHDIREMIITSTIKPVTPKPQPLNTQPPQQRRLHPEMASSSKQSHENNTKPISSDLTKVDEMMRKQTSNFRAFSRTLVNIDLDIIVEKWELEDVLKSLESRWRPIDDLYWEIDSLMEEKDAEFEERFSQYESKYSIIKKEINSRLYSMCHREQSTPRLDIPTFNGNYQQWVSFKDLFVEAIHNNPHLSHAQKMQFLKSKIKGEPERLIQHLPISSDNYVTCWDILNQRYSNKKLIFGTHMNTLLSLPVTQQATSNHIKRIHDVTVECLNGIKNLGVDIDSWDPFLVHILSQKLDMDTHNDYMASLKEPRELPSIKEFLKFLENKFTTLESSRRKHENVTQKINIEYPSTSRAPRPQQNRLYYSSNKATNNKNQQSRKISCPICEKEHGIYFCTQFREMAPTQKLKTISQLNLCVNCLYSHKGQPCNSPKRCRECNGCHNSILHDACSNKGEQNEKKIFYNRNFSSSNTALYEDEQEILLATALIKVQGSDGLWRTMRALIDQGSQVSLLTENAAQVLKLQRHKCKGVITGVGTNDNTCKGMISMTCAALRGSYTFSTNAYIMKSLTRNLPSFSFPKPSWKILDSIQLADPEFYISNPIDILLGADVYSRIILNGIQRHGESMPVAQKTRLGWILCGKVQTLQCNLVLNNIEDIQKFWEIEDVQENTALSTEEQECIEFYKSTTKRLQDGSYQVRLPLKLTCKNQLGQSKSKAIAQFMQLERKLNKNIIIATQYTAFMTEYLTLGHMMPTNNYGKGECTEYYLPHHGVVREDSTTTALRVVFNGSQPTSNGMSLNDIMHKGPNLQNDLMLLILKWRQHRIALVADIEKMFRKIWLHPDDQHYQKIVWRDPYILSKTRSSHMPPLQEYQLTTVSYGTKAAPFLAMMTLRQLAHDERKKYPEAARIVEECFFMDDLLHGSSSVSSANRIKQDLTQLLKTGGFNLRKWKSNHEDLSDITNKSEHQQESYDFKQPESTKTLGLHWDPKQDIFIFQCKIDTNKDTSSDTKRKLLSEISKLFDPLGWLTPISTKLKILFQNTWKSDLKWDDKLPEIISKEWSKIKQEIEIINNFTIPRWLGTESVSNIELHGYCDASQKAYACVVYCKLQKLGQIKTILLAGKSKLVPCKKQVTLPKLELMGAQLLAKLMERIKSCLQNHKIMTYGWTDSTAVLGWIQGNPANWKVFVANRVREITSSMPSDCWRYVKSAENPADCASRGLTPSQLAQHSLWWQGPHWLSSFKAEENEKRPTYMTQEEAKIHKQVNVSLEKPKLQDNIVNCLINKYSSFNKLVRVLAWVRRFIFKSSRNQYVKQETYLTVPEIRQAKLFLIKQVQEQYFEEEIINLKEEKEVSNRSKILKLTPFLDENDVLRVGGRLQYAHIHPDMKNPIILPSDSRLTELLIDQAHKLTYHGGARMVLGFLRQKYWIIKGNNTTKKIIRKCVTCRRQNPNKNYQIMGDLPGARVNKSRPFLHTGVDFTGHVFIKASKGRGIKTTKGYVAVFVCMATKAVHLELVSDLTTSGLIAALRRMSARRGTPHHVYSDNGRNLLGASNVLQKEYQDLQEIMMNDGFVNEISDMEITWHFNAPAWPSAGGLWEAAVKSFKFHLKRVIGEQRLTYEEFTTLLTQIEACLNSRPLCPLSEDPDDMDYLTPSHFLNSGPTLTLIETERDLRTRWQLTQKILQDLWKRWSTEYLSQLNIRSKWTRSQNNLSLNDVVLIQDDNLPPGKWAMGRVISLHPGKDGYVRVVTVKTKNGTLKRPIVKLSLLLNEQDSNLNNKKQILNAETIPIPTEKPKRTRTQSRRFNVTSLFAALLFFMTVITSSHCSMNVTQFRENQKLYFDKITNMLLIREEWKLVAFYNMDPYWQANQIFNQYTISLQNSCNIITQSSHCDVVMIQLRHAYSELQYYNQVLLSQHETTRRNNRKRRGLINGVGYIANSLFGVLDERFATQYRKDIDLIQENQKHLATLWKNQTSIIEAENNLLKRTENVINKQYKLINKHMMELEKVLSTMKNTVNLNSILNDFNTGAIIANSMIHNLKDIQSTLLDTMTDVYHGSFNLHLLTPEQLMNELSVISSQLPKDVCLPINNVHTELHKIYHLLQVKARMLEDALIFEIRIPLVSRESYEIMNIISIPKQEGNKMISIVPVAEYVSINLKKDTYIPMSNQNLQDCIHTSDKYYCRIRKPVYHMKGDQSFCQKDSTNCKTITRPCINSWEETYVYNSYVYFCCNQCQVRTMCEDQMAVTQLTLGGIVNIGHECIIKTDDFTVLPHKPHVTEIRTNFDIYTPTLAPINNIINLTIPNMTLGNEPELLRQDILRVEDRIKDMEKVDTLSGSVSYHDIHHYTMIYVLFGISCVTALILIVRRAQCIKCKWRVPQPPAQAPAPAARASSSVGMQTQPPRQDIPLEPRTTRVPARVPRNPLFEV